MVYVTVRQHPMYKQLTMEEFLDGDDSSTMITSNISNTRTYLTDESKLAKRVNVKKLIEVLENFNNKYETLRNTERTALYHSFCIPKKSGGLRQIDAPLPELMNALRELKEIFETNFAALYHTAAFAYVEHRSTLDAVKRHQANHSKWFLKLDAHNFFGSTTKEFVMQMLERIAPFCVVLHDTKGYEEMDKALDLCFLHGVLPQGTPISPLLTNIMMIPIDHALYNGLRNLNGNHFVYTRYADDMLISNSDSFLYKPVVEFVNETLRAFHAPFHLNEEKTRYGSAAGRNWNLGLMLNKDNQITVGHKNKKQFQNMLSSYAKDKKTGITWSRHDVQVLDGLRNYYHMVEGETIDRIIEFVSNKFGVDIKGEMKKDLRAATMAA